MSTNMNPTPNPNIASLTWKIDNFTTLTEDPIQSPTFSPPANENVSFLLALYHKAKFCYTSEISKPQIALFLKRDEKSSLTSSVEYRVSLVNVKGEKCHTILKQIQFGKPDLVVIENRGCTYRRDFVIDPKNKFLTENSQYN